MIMGWFKAEAPKYFFFENQDVEVMGWQTKSPAMKPIEHIRDQMAIHIRDMDNLTTTPQQLHRWLPRVRSRESGVLYFQQQQKFTVHSVNNTNINTIEI